MIRSFLNGFSYSAGTMIAQLVVGAAIQTSAFQTLTKLAMQQTGGKVLQKEEEANEIGFVTKGGK